MQTGNKDWADEKADEICDAITSALFEPFSHIIAQALREERAAAEKRCKIEPEYFFQAEDEEYGHHDPHEIVKEFAKFEIVEIHGVAMVSKFFAFHCEIDDHMQVLTYPTMEEAEAGMEDIKKVLEQKEAVKS